MNSIKFRLIAAILALAACLAIGGAIGWSSLNFTSMKLDSVIAGNVDPLGMLDKVGQAYHADVIDTAWKVRSGKLGWDEALTRIDQGRQTVQANWRTYGATPMEEEEKHLAAQVGAAIDAADKATLELRAILERRDQSALEAFTDKEMYPQIDPVAGRIRALADYQIAGAKSEGEAGHKVAGLMFMAMFGIGAMVIAALGFSVWTVIKGVSAPMQHLTDMMRKLAAGHLDLSVPGQDRKDELGDMSRAVVVFRNNAIERQRLEAETEAQRNQTEEERRFNEQARAEAAQAQSIVVEAIGNGLDRLSTGDLTHRIDTTFDPTYEKLRSDFNNTMAQLQSTIANVVNRTQGLRASGEEITQASDDLSRRTEQQAASLEETAAALDQITATVRRTADGALEAQKVVTAAKGDAQSSSKVVQEAVLAMHEIEQSSRQITQIIGVIDEIAFQTNLLALNAGVEAARAGDAGRGFAVVASEVRGLAQRSAEAAKEIKSLISASTDHVAQGVSRVGETGRTLSRISDHVSQINEVVSEISASAQEQATGLNQVNAAVNQMDQVTQQNAAMVEQATAASHSLREETDAVVALMAQFRVGEISTTDASAQSKPSRANPVHAVQQKLAVGMGGGRGAQSWDEF